MREPSRMCWACGYHTTAAAPAFPGAKGNETPDEGDVSMCLNCGAICERKSDNWVPISFDALDQESRDVITRMRAVRARVIKTNLAKRPGNA